MAPPAKPSKQNSTRQTSQSTSSPQQPPHNPPKPSATHQTPTHPLSHSQSTTPSSATTILTPSSSSVTSSQNLRDTSLMPQQAQSLASSTAMTSSQASGLGIATPATPTTATLGTPVTAAPVPNENVWLQMAATRAAQQAKKDSQSAATSNTTAAPQSRGSGTPGLSAQSTGNATPRAAQEEKHVPVNGFNREQVRALLTRGFNAEAKIYEARGIEGNGDGRSGKERERDALRVLQRGFVGAAGGSKGV